MKKYNQAGVAVIVLAISFGLGGFFAPNTAHAATPFANDYMIVSFNRSLPIGTKLDVVWASKKQPAKLWIFDWDFWGTTVTGAIDEVNKFPHEANEFLLDYFFNYDEDSMTAETAGQALGEPAYLAVTAQLPTGEVYMSEPVKNYKAVFDFNKKPIAKPTDFSSYNLKVTYVDDQGTRIPINNANIELLEHYSFVGQFIDKNEVLAVKNGRVKNIGPLPMEVLIDFTSPDDPNVTLFGFVEALPAEGNGTFEFVMYDSLAQFERKHANDSEAEYEAADDLFFWNDLQKYIFTPDSAGQIVTGPGSVYVPPVIVVGPPLPLKVGSYVRLSRTPISEQLKTTKFGIHSVDIGIANVAASVPRVPGEKVGTVTLKKLVLNIASANFNGNLPALTVRIVHTLKNSKLKFSKPFTCTPGSADPSSCLVQLPITQTLLSGKSARIGIVVDTAPLKKGETITMKIAKPTDLRFTYNQKNGKKKMIKIDHTLESTQAPFGLPSITK